MDNYADRVYPEFTTSHSDNPSFLSDISRQNNIPVSSIEKFAEKN